MVMRDSFDMTVEHKYIFIDTWAKREREWANWGGGNKRHTRKKYTHDVSAPNLFFNDFLLSPLLGFIEKKKCMPVFFRTRKATSLLYGSQWRYTLLVYLSHFFFLSPFSLFLSSALIVFPLSSTSLLSETVLYYCGGCCCYLFLQAVGVVVVSLPLPSTLRTSSSFLSWTRRVPPHRRASTQGKKKKKKWLILASPLCASLLEEPHRHWSPARL